MWLSIFIALSLAPACGARSELGADNARGACSDDSGGPSPPPVACTDPTVGDPNQVLMGYDPPMGHPVGWTGQVRVWVSGDSAPFVAPGEVVDNMTGAVTTPGDRAATAKDGLLYEPTLYIAPQSPTDGGTPYFPQWIRGSYNDNPPSPAGWYVGEAPVTKGAPVDPIPPGSAIKGPGFWAVSPAWSPYETEFVWDVSALGLGCGSYTAVFSVNGGASRGGYRATGCATIAITR